MLEAVMVPDVIQDHIDERPSQEMQLSMAVLVQSLVTFE
jgi:hypothetical protein